MFRNILTFVVFTLSLGLQAQEVVRQHIGTQGLNTPKKINYTVGQSLIHGGDKMHYGYQRPLLWSVGVKNTESLTPELYPNPFTSVLQFSGLPTGAVFIQLHNMSGQLVAQQRLRATESKLTLDLNHLSTGTYLVSIRTADQSAVFKVVKQYP